MNITDRERIIEEGLAALARHYGYPPEQVAAEVMDLTSIRHTDSFMSLVESLIVALGVLNDWGFDDAAVMAAERQAGERA